MLTPFRLIFDHKFEKQTFLARFQAWNEVFRGLKSCQEITIKKIVIQNLADYCIDKNYTSSLKYNAKFSE